MTFKEMQEKYDPYGAYRKYITMEEAFSSGLFPLDYKEYFDTHCQCGSEVIINSNLRQFTCCDPRCDYKMYQQLAEIFSRFGILGIGPAICEEFYFSVKELDNYRVSHGEPTLLTTGTIIDFLVLPFNNYPEDFARKQIGSAYYQACLTIKNTPVTFSRLVQLLAIPSIVTTSKKLFENVNTIEEFVKVIKIAGGIQNYCFKNNIFDESIPFWLNVYKMDIAVFYHLLKNNIRKHSFKKLSVVLTGAMKYGGFATTKAKVVEMCNKIGRLEDNTQLLELENCSASKTCTYIVYSVPDDTANQNTGRERGTFIDFDGEERPVLITVDELVELFTKRVECMKSMLYQADVDDTNDNSYDINDSLNIPEEGVNDRECQENYQIMKTF